MLQRLEMSPNRKAIKNKGQSLQEYGLIAGLVVIVAIGSLSMLGQSNQNMMQNNTEGVFGKNQDGPAQKLVSLLGPVQNPNNPNSLTSPIGTFQFQGTQGNYQFSVDPETGYYQLNQSTNTTSSEGLNSLFDFTNDATGMLKQLAETGTLPDGTTLSTQERAALSQLSEAGLGLNGAQLWLGGTKDKLIEMGVFNGGFEGGLVNDKSYLAWGFTHGNTGENILGTNDYRIMDGLVQRYKSFQETFTQVAPLLSQNEKLKNMVSPIIGAIDQVSRKQFYQDPVNYGNNQTAFEYVNSKIPPALDIRGPVVGNNQNTSSQTGLSSPGLSNNQAIDFTYQASQQFEKASGNAGGTPSLGELMQTTQKS
jgi:Flp pilus assembly pilin Flp